MTDLRATYLHAMSMAASTVSVVTTDGAAGRAGVTVSAMTSVSADGPAPTMLVCVNQSSSAADPILSNECFAINLLATDQQALANIFASRQPAPNGDKFAGTDWTTLSTGAPILPGLAVFDCTLQSSQLVGTHYVMIGAVQAMQAADAGEPLIYGRRSYLRAHPA